MLFKAAAVFLAAVAAAFGGWAGQVSSDMAARAVNTLMADEGQLECQVSGSVSSVRLWTLLVGDMAARQESLSANSKSGIRAMSAASEQDNSSSAEARWTRLTAPDGSASSAGPGLRTFKASALRQRGFRHAKKGHWQVDV